MIVKFKKLVPEAVTPSYSNRNENGFGSTGK